LAADPPDPDKAEGFPAELAADELRARPLAGANAAIRVDEAPEESEREREGVLGRGDDVAEGSVHDVDAARGRRRHVDVVYADARATNDDEALRGVEDGRGHLGLAPHDQRVDIRDARRELGPLPPGGLANLAARAEQRETLFGNRVR